MREARRTALWALGNLACVFLGIAQGFHPGMIAANAFFAGVLVMIALIEARDA